jgi:hypothetical protein
VEPARQRQRLGLGDHDERPGCLPPKGEGEDVSAGEVVQVAGNFGAPVRQFRVNIPSYPTPETTMPFEIPCKICGTVLIRPYRNKPAVCPDVCLRELRRRTGKRLAAEGKIPKMTPEIQAKAAKGRTGKGKGWLNGGYRFVRHDGRNVAEHRLVMERHIGRPLAPEEIVHHINHDPLDNRIENLHLYASRSEHFADGHPEMTDQLPKTVETNCAECGVAFRTPDTAKRQSLCRNHRRYHRRYV